MRFTWTLMAVALLSARIAVANDAAPGRTKSADNAAITTLGEKIDPDGDCEAVESEGKAVITVPGTWHDLTHGTKYVRLNAPRFLDDARGNFSLQLKVDPFTLPKPHDSSGGDFAFVSTGIVVWLNQTNFIRFECAGVSIRRYLFVERFESGQSISQKNEDIPEAPTWLRVTRQGDRLKFQRSPDGESWTTVQTLSAATLPKRLKVGVHAINTTNEAFRAVLSGYQFVP